MPFSHKDRVVGLWVLVLATTTLESVVQAGFFRELAEIVVVTPRRHLSRNFRQALNEIQRTWGSCGIPSDTHGFLLLLFATTMTLLTHESVSISNTFLFAA